MRLAIPRYPRFTQTIRIIGCALWTLAALTLAARADWPTARGNAGRTATSPVGPTRDLAPAWTLHLAPAAPAWPGEARGSLWQRLTNSLTARAADDLAPVPIVVQDRVLFGTTQDEIRSVELTSGRTVWRFFCGGPVRFAPAAMGDLAFFGSDDGYVYALEIRTGALRWKVRVGPERPLISGNGRLISPCPVRSGVLAVDGKVYVAAGLFPVEGTYLVALAAEDGRLLWRRDLGSDSPQGYLADAGADVLVPCGRAQPKLYRKSDGGWVRNVASALGTLAVVSDTETLAGPGPTGSFQGADARTGARIVSYPGRQLAVTRSRTFLVNGLELLALDRERLRNGPAGSNAAVVWKTECSGGTSLVVAGSRLYCGTSAGVEVYDAETGAHRQTLEAPGAGVALAADAAGIVVSTREGNLRAFLESPATPSASASVPAADSVGVLKVTDPVADQRVARWLQEMPIERGWALWLRPDDPWSAVAALVARSQLHVIVALPEAEVPRARLRLAEAGWLGTRVAVVSRRSDGSVPSVDHLFNLVIATAEQRAEALRCVVPGASGWLAITETLEVAPADTTAGQWTHQYGSAANTCASSQPLKGYPRLQWFGGHGPERMPDRHTRGHAPLAAGGLQLSMAENALIATDARNGTVRWELELPGSMRYVLPYDAGYAALRPDGRTACVAVDAELWWIDTLRGRVTARQAYPEDGLHWGWVALDGDQVFASAEFPSAPRTEKKFELVDLDYRSERPLVTSRVLARVEATTGKLLWQRPTPGAWVNSTLCAHQGRVYAVEARGPAARADLVGRLTCAQIDEDAWVVAIDAATGTNVWQRPLGWPKARDILGLSAQGDRLFLSAAESVGEQAAYHLRCWNASEGRELWSADALNPIRDLYHGQQVKRPVLLGSVVAFESGLFEVATGRKWLPPGSPESWILSRPGHACGGMTGGEGALLFRADNPTFFRLADGTFTRLAPTRPGCWLNILPAEGGVLIPEASASCVCGYPLQTSMAFSFGAEPVPRAAGP